MNELKTTISSMFPSFENRIKVDFFTRNNELCCILCSPTYNFFSDDMKKEEVKRLKKNKEIKSKVKYIILENSEERMSRIFPMIDIEFEAEKQIIYQCSVGEDVYMVYQDITEAEKQYNVNSYIVNNSKIISKDSALFNKETINKAPSEENGNFVMHFSLMEKTLTTLGEIIDDKLYSSPKYDLSVYKTFVLDFVEISNYINVLTLVMEGK